MTIMYLYCKMKHILWVYVSGLWIQKPLSTWICIWPHFESKINQICIKDVLHVPKLHVNLLWVSKLVLIDFKVQFNLNIVNKICKKSILWWCTKKKWPIGYNIQHEMLLLSFGTTMVISWTWKYSKWFERWQKFLRYILIVLYELA